ncbi:MAG: hypothetical protein ACREDJ_07630, partial [Methylocella sp.]
NSGRLLSVAAFGSLKRPEKFLAVSDWTDSVARIFSCAGASRRRFGLAKAHPGQHSSPRNLVIV